MDLAGWLALFAAAAIAGAVNAVAGGGSLISFPALIAAGYSSRTANVTNSVALWPGYAAASYGYRRELIPQRRRLLLLLVPAVTGALAGALLLLATPDSAFDAAVPFLILLATGLLLAQDRLAALVGYQHGASTTPAHVTPGLMAGVFLLAIYGGYFGGGLGIVLLAFLGIVLPDDLQRSNALKAALSLLINAVAVAWFAAFGPVAWGPAVLMAAGSLLGGYAGVGFARRLSPGRLRLVVAIYGVTVAAVLLVQG